MGPLGAAPAVWVSYRASVRRFLPPSSFSTLDPLRLETPAPRPGTHWVAHLEAWRAVLVLSVVAVAVLVLFVAARTLARRSVNDLETGDRERLMLGALSCVFYLGLLALIGEMISGDYDGSGSPGLTVSIICIGVVLWAGVVMADRLKGVGSLHARFHERPVGQKSHRKALVALVPLCVLVAVASFANIEGAATAMDQVRSGNLAEAVVEGLTPGSAPSNAFPTSLLVKLSGGFGWASVGFANFVASDPNLPVSTGSPSCSSGDCVITGTGNGGDEVLGLVRGSSVAWRGRALPGQYPLVSPLACASNLDCIVPNDNYGFAVTSDGGRHWSDLRLPENIEASVASLYSATVACVPAGQCFALSGSRTLTGCSAALPLPVHRRAAHCCPRSRRDTPRHPRLEHKPLEPHVPDPSRLPRGRRRQNSSLVHHQDRRRRPHLENGRPGERDPGTRPAGLPRRVPLRSGRRYGMAERLRPGSRDHSHEHRRRHDLALLARRAQGTILTSVACMSSRACIASGETASAGSWDGILPAGGLFVVSTVGVGLPWTKVQAPRGRFAASGAACGAQGCVITGEELEPGPAGDFFDGMNLNGSPATTGVVLRWAPATGLRLLRTSPLPRGVVQPVVAIP